LAQAYSAHANAILLGVVEAPAAILLGASADAGIDAGATLKAALAAAGGRGGGNPRLAQGTVEPAAIDTVLTHVLTALHPPA
jgi:alanyl-tRNA synthetase